MWELMTREFPYDDSQVETYMLRELIVKGLRPTMPKRIDFPRRFVNLMQECWAQDPGSRPRFSTVLESLRAMLPDGHLADEF